MGWMQTGMSRIEESTTVTEEILSWKLGDLETSVPARFERVAARFPQQVAIKTNSEAISYAALNKAANRIAHGASSRSSSPEPTALLLEHGAWPVAAILGILKSGKFYLALDPSHPTDRLRTIVRNAGADLIVTNSRNLNLALQLAADESAVMNIDAIPGDVPDTNGHISIKPDDSFGLFYTSGSTGQPKGILHNHRHILHRAMTLAKAYQLGPTDRMPLTVSCSWLWSVAAIFGTLLNGGRLYPYDTRLSSIRDLLNLLVTEEITVFGILPSVFRQISAVLTSKAAGRSSSSLPNLRLLSVGTEPIYGSEVDLWRGFLEPECVLANVLACSEAGVLAWDFVDLGQRVQDGTMPVGYAAPDKEITLTDELGRPVAPGEIGEIVVRSPYLFSGYWKKPDLTRAVLQPDPDGSGIASYSTGDLGFLQADGRLVVTGRKDRQVKVRGNTVQPAEVEMILLDHHRIREAVVTTHTYSRGQQLVAHLIPYGDTRPTSGELRTYLKELLPEFAIPAVFDYVDNLPRTPHGKVDLQALPAPDLSRRHLTKPFVAPQGTLEEALLSIWSDTLGIPDVGAEDDFFELGGDSLLASRLCLEIESRLGRTVTPPVLAEAPTLARLAAAIEHEKQAATRGSVVPLRQGGAHPPLFFVHGIGGGVLDYIPTIRHLKPGRPVYGLATDHLDFAKAQSASFEGLAATYANEIVTFRPSGPYLLAGYSYGGIVAFEIARQLVTQGHRVAMLGIIDCPAPGAYYSSFPLRPAVVAPFLNNLPRWLRAFLRLGPKRMLDTMKGKGRAVQERIRARLDHGAPTSTWIAQLDLSQADEAKIAFMHQQSRLLADYVPGEYPGPVTLFRARTQPLFCSFSPHMGWEPLVRDGLEIKDIPGTHHDLLSSHAHGLAERLQKTLDRSVQQTAA
ncbi:AMP-binding protein [Chloroflexota bacterium]